MVVWSRCWRLDTSRYGQLCKCDGFHSYRCCLSSLGKDMPAVMVRLFIPKWFSLLPKAVGRRHNSIHAKNSFVTLGPIADQLPEIARIHPDELLTYKDFHEYSLRETDRFWGALARNRLSWFRDFQIIQECDMKNARFGWFLGGKLNVAVNCVDRHAAKTPDKVALIWEQDQPGQEQRITYGELQILVNQAANMLRAHGVRKGDCVAIYMSVSPMEVVAMLACARIGAVHNVIFGGFSPDAIASRINDAGAETVITADQGFRGGKTVELKRTMDQALTKCPSVKRVFVFERTGASVPKGPKDISLLEEMAKQSPESEAEGLDSEDPLFMLYTSGSTGKPKGILHTQAGYLLHAAVTHKLVFDYRDGDIFGCMADIGWITGHSYVVYGPLANGGTTVLFESMPTYPDAGRYWETVQRLGITHLYISPTAIRSLHRFSSDYVNKYDRSSLRVLGSVGEPINHEAWEWLRSVAGREKCMVVDTWWQTETGGICIAPCPADTDAEIKPAIAMRPFFGIQPVLMDEKGKELKGPGYGALCLSKPWPGMARTIFGDHDRFVKTYFATYPGYYFTGDGAHIDADGDYQITGRMDDVINVSGHRLGTAEVEDVLDNHPSVAETAVVGFPHSIKGEGIFAFVSLKEGEHKSDLDISAELKKLSKNAIAGYAVPDHILITPALPKTRSGKIMRRVLRQIAQGKLDNFGDLTTLADPTSVEHIVNEYKKQKNRV